MELTLPVNALAQLGGHHQAAFVMETSIGSIALNALALVSVADWAREDTVTMVLTAVPKAREADSQPLWAWRILCGENEITSLNGGQAEVSVPYTLDPRQDPECVIIRTQDIAGGWHEAETAYDVQAQSARFAAAAPCVFTVGYDETLAWAGGFADVDKQAWYYPAVRYVCFHGMMNGTSGESFAPENQLTRAQMAQLLYNLEGRSQAGKVNYSDVSQDAWYAPAIGWAVQSGILTGYGNGRIGPDDPITREQLAVMLYRYAEQKGFDTSAQADLDEFTDRDAVSSYARLPLAWAHASGIINGTGAATLSPGGMATRAQSAAMLMRFHENARN